MSTASLSRFVRLGINANTVATYNPFSELNEKYRKQVVFASEIIEFAKGTTVFSGHIDRSRYYFLLKGKLSFKTGMLSKKTIDSRDSYARFDISTLLPDGIDVVAVEPGYMLSVEAVMLDTALAWMQARDIEVAPVLTPKQAFTTALPEVETTEEEDDGDWMSLLLASPLFFNLPPANISRLFTLFERIPVKKGDVIVRQGDQGDDFYVLITGRADVVVDDRHDKPETELTRGSYFGEGALVSGEPRSASVIMTADGELGRLDRENFQSLLVDPVVKYVSTEDVGKQLLKHKSHCVLFDVRSPEEFRHAPSPNSRNVPCQELRSLIPTLAKDCTYFISPEGGKRSQLAAHLLSQADLKAFVIKPD